MMTEEETIDKIIKDRTCTNCDNCFYKMMRFQYQCKIANAKTSDDVLWYVHHRKKEIEKEKIERMKEILK